MDPTQIPKNLNAMIFNSYAVQRSCRNRVRSHRPDGMTSGTVRHPPNADGLGRVTATVRLGSRTPAIVIGIVCCVVVGHQVRAAANAFSAFPGLALQQIDLQKPKTPSGDGPSTTQGKSSSADETNSGATSVPLSSTRSLGNPFHEYWRVGFSLTPMKTAINKKAEAILPIPGDWPEQYVQIHSETSTPGLSYEQRDVDEGLRALFVKIPHTAVSDKVELSVVYDITLTPLGPPLRPEYCKKPTEIGHELTRYVGSSELIEPRSSAVKKLATEIIEGKPNDWQRVEAMYDWVLDHIEMTSAAAVGAPKVLETNKGCREDRVNLFVALCRSQRIPARFVWANRIEYAEFYLLDEAGTGVWYPCMLSGPREFGSLAKPVIIEQKGDNFEVPGKRGKQRFVVDRLDIDARADRAPTIQYHFTREQVFEPQLKQQ